MSCAILTRERKLYKHWWTSRKDFKKNMKYYLLSLFVLVRVLHRKRINRWEGGRERERILKNSLMWLWRPANPKICICKLKTRRAKTVFLVQRLVGSRFRKSEGFSLSTLGGKKAMCQLEGSQAGRNSFTLWMVSLFILFRPSLD